MAETQNDPLLPGYSFNAHLVAGLTPIEAEGYLDFYVDRPLGMKGYILNLTVREGIIKNGDQQFVCRPGDILLFPPGRSTTMAVIRMPKSGITSGSTSVRAPTGRSGFPGRLFLHTGFYRPDEVHLAQFRELFAQIIDAGQAGGRYAELLAINLLEQLLLRRMEAINESLNRRWITACATPASTSATTWPTASLILPASPSTSACRRRGCRTCSASSLASASELARGSAHQPGETAAQHHPDADCHRGAQRGL
jgi:hypothetical protein